MTTTMMKSSATKHSTQRIARNWNGVLDRTVYVPSTDSNQEGDPKTTTLTQVGNPGRAQSTRMRTEGRRGQEGGAHAPSALPFLSPNPRILAKTRSGNERQCADSLVPVDVNETSVNQ